MTLEHTEVVTGNERILVVLMEDDYGVPGRGTSHEFYNVYLPMLDEFPTTVLFDYAKRMRAVGRQGMNEELIDLVRSMRPDVTVVTLYTDEFDPTTVREMNRWTRTVGYFFDDTWRQSYAQSWARHFSFVTTPEHAGLAIFARAGVENVILSPFGWNERLYGPRDIPNEFDVSFVGQWHPLREWIVEQLRAEGLAVAAFGHGWPGGRLQLDEMVRVFSATSVNLNLDNSAAWGVRYLLRYPRSLAANLRHRKRVRQVKARHFEIAGCGSFQLSFAAPGLPEFFVPGGEMVTFDDVPDLMKKIRHYLGATEERARIASAALVRARREHTAQRRSRQLIEDVLKRSSAVTR